ncbi:MAG: AcrB/AcrD/AcrF family protein [Ancylobacter novellus]|uniref:AcrB/AcrD/AcrF family protein n=1 Tax=Ancylobacter novellus TaxID=921 RepID=A0A2W5KG81_ANCNO|nr:MAG: AcrB/AcrD/AcrF family protein [Ancylobacter novellus]
MWIVAYALRRPYTIAVMAALILLAGLSALRNASTDILPAIDLPAVQVVWTYQGLDPQEMAAKITSFSEIAILNNVDDIRSVSSQTSAGVGIVRVEFQPSVSIELALSQISAVSQTILRRMPPGAQPPLVVRYSQGSVPILQLALSSFALTEPQLYDYARLQLRSQIQTIPGIRMTLPYGGAVRQIMVDLDPDRLQAYGVSADDVSRAVTSQNLTLPSGALRDAGREVFVSLNSSPETVEAFNSLPLREVDGRVVFMRDVAHVRDGGAVPTNVARVDGEPGVIVQLLKLGSASTVDIVDQVMERLPAIRAAAPEGMRIEPIFDQSTFVKSAVDSVLKEGVLVGALVALVVIVFVGSMRSAAIVLVSIPLALMASVAGLTALGHTLNLMTLGGLALAIGILVDNALVEIENINRNLDEGKEIRQAVMDSARQVVFPEFVSTSCICIVFLPVFALSGTPLFIFAPLALAVVFAMIASFVLSRTLVPTLAFLMLPAEVRAKRQGRRSWLSRAHSHVEHALDALRDRYRGMLSGLMRVRLLPALAAALVIAGAGWTMTTLGREFFPVVDAGTLRIHLRAPSGARIEETARIFADVQREIRALLPKGEAQAIVENIGAPDPVNLAWVDSLAATSSEGEMLVQLRPGHAPSAEHQARIAAMLKERFPDVVAFFRPADIVGQTLNGAAAGSIDIRVAGRDRAGNLAAARALADRVRQIRGATDVMVRQIPDWPEYRIAVDKARAAQLGVTQQAIANALLISLSSSSTVQSSYWADGGVSYVVAVQTPPDRLRSLDDLLNTPVTTSRGGTSLLRTFATATERKTPATVSRATLQPAFNVLVNVSGRDLGGVLAEVEPMIAELRGGLKPGNAVTVSGQAAQMTQAYAELAGGVALAVLLIFLLLVVNFQSWTLPLAALAALPMALSGAIYGLAATGSYLSVPALTGFIMVLGVSTANSVLVVSFARDLMAEGREPVSAALEAAATRLRPVLMTASAMIVGMAPMALGLGEGGEQNAPLGRAVIGGLMLGTLGTLLLVPLAVTAVRRRRIESAESSAAPETARAPGAA